MRRAWLLATLMVGLVVVLPAHAGSDDALIRLLIRKGILTQEDAEALKQEMEAEAAREKAAATPAPAGAAAPAAAAAGQAPVTEAQLNETVGRARNEILTELAEKEEAAISISATLSTEGRYRLYPDPADRSSKNSSELYLRTAQIDFEFRPLSWIVANLTVKSEYFGADTTNEYQEADPTPFIDVGTITLRDEQFPLYGVFGKRTQPNGVFFGDDRFNTDPISKNAYEVNQTGVTVGYAPPDLYGLDLSFTLYRQEQQMDQLFASGLFDNTVVVRQSSVGLAEPSNSITSFIFAAVMEPISGLQVGASYLSESGAGTRNQTVGVWAGYTWWEKLTLEAEFYAALSREKYVRQVTTDDVTTPVLLGQAFKEKILALGVTWKPIPPLEVGGRAELYWDDGLADAAQTWTTNYRLIAGAGYTVYEKGDIAVRLIGEYRYTDFRQGGSASQTGAPNNHELFGKIAVTYK